MRERMVELRKAVAVLEEMVRAMNERVTALESSKTLRLPKK